MTSLTCSLSEAVWTILRSLAVVLASVTGAEVGGAGGAEAMMPPLPPVAGDEGLGATSFAGRGTRGWFCDWAVVLRPSALSTASSVSSCRRSRGAVSVMAVPLPPDAAPRPPPKATPRPPMATRASAAIAAKRASLGVFMVSSCVGALQERRGRGAFCSGKPQT